MRLIDADLLKLEIACVYGSNPQYINWLNHAPTVDAVPVRHGKWIKVDKDNMFFVPHILKCSLCGNILDRHGVNAGRGDVNYCPNCGARMVEDE